MVIPEARHSTQRGSSHMWIAFTSIAKSSAEYGYAETGASEKVDEKCERMGNLRK